MLVLFERSAREVDLAYGLVGSSQLVALLRCDELIGIAEVHAKHRHDLEAEHIATASSALPSACRARRFAAAALRHA